MVFALRLCVSAVIFLLTSCSSTPTDVRTVIPGDALVYLETQDLGKALHAVTDNDAFRAAAKSQPDFSALNGIRVGVAVTGFESKDIPAADGASELNIQPRFVAVAETNAWNYQAIKFAENKLGEFVNDIYGGGVELERFPRFDGDYFIWTAQDGRKAYGLVIGSLIFFGNDESAIEKCVSVRKGEGESLAKSGRLPSGDYLATGYVSTDGVAQIANIASIQFAVGAGEEDEVRGFIARVLPEILRKSITEVTWTASRNEQGIADEINLEMIAEVANVLKETVQPTLENLEGNHARRMIPNPTFLSLNLAPSDVVSATRYDLTDPQIAWRSVLLTAQKQTDGVSGAVIGAVAESLFEAYGVDVPEEFLGSISGQILTLRFDPEGEDVVVVATTRDMDRFKTSLAKEFRLNAPGESLGDATLWRSEEGELAFASLGDRVLLGHAESVVKCLNSVGQGGPLLEELKSTGSFVSTTIASDTDPQAVLVAVLGQRVDAKTPLIQRARVSTSFTGNGIQRTEISQFGVIGWLIEQFGKE
jgi:hypothetical protein